MLARSLLLAASLWLLGTSSDAAEQADSAARADPIASRAVMSGEQVVQILDETVDWYRTLGTQQQAATQPSDLLILYANRQTADKVMALAFEIARANAELISSEAGAQQEQQEASTPESQSLARIEQKLAEQRTQLQSDIDSLRRQIGAAAAQQRGDLQARLAVLQAELDLVNARRNLFANMSQYANENVGANALKAHIDAIAASIPSASAAPVTTTTAAPAPGATAVTAAVSTSLSQFGIWDLAATVLRLSAKARTIETVDRRTEELQEVFTQIRDAPLQQLQALAERGDALAAQASSGDRASLKRVRDQYDTIAWLFQQTSAIVTPLSKAEVLLTQYRNNLDNWREATQRQSREAWRVLGLRLVIFGALLALVFTAAEVWRRAVFRYVEDARRRSRLLLLRKIVLWALVVAIAAATFATELGSLATFAGLITAGLAVAMQSVLVSVVGYFFLIGKYGVRIGDRVQVGNNVIGEVIDLGLVRMHLMELSGQGGAMRPTGRVVAFPNSIIFQASSGLFKQVPGIDLAWREITVRLPAGADPAALKTRLLAAVGSVLEDYRDAILRQTQEIQRTASAHGASDAQPQVQLRFSAEGVDAVVRYPVELQHAAEIDERVSREVLSVISAEPATAPAA